MAMAEKIIAQQEAAMAKRKTDLATKYPHALVDTIRALPHGANGMVAYAVDVKCVVTGEVFGPVFTSDLFQVNTLPEVRKAAKAKAKAAHDAEIKEALALIAARKAQPQG
jgi:hypothetical protein